VTTPGPKEHFVRLGSLFPAKRGGGIQFSLRHITLACCCYNLTVLVEVAVDDVANDFSETLSICDYLVIIIYMRSVKNLEGGVVGVRAPLVLLGWRPPGLSVPLPPLSSPAP